MLQEFMFSIGQFIYRSHSRTPFRLLMVQAKHCLFEAAKDSAHLLVRQQASLNLTAIFWAKSVELGERVRSLAKRPQYGLLRALNLTLAMSFIISLATLVLLNMKSTKKREQDTR